MHAFGRVPKSVKGSSEAEVRERKLAHRFKNAKSLRRGSAAEKNEVAGLGDAIQLAERMEQLMHDIRSLGRVPKRVHGNSEADVRERNVERRLLLAMKQGHVSAVHQAELAELRASEIGGLQEAQGPPDVLDPFADGAANRLEQDLLMFSNGIGLERSSGAYSVT